MDHSEGPELRHNGPSEDFTFTSLPAPASLATSLEEQEPPATMDNGSQKP